MCWACLVPPAFLISRSSVCFQHLFISALLFFPFLPLLSLPPSLFCKLAALVRHRISLFGKHCRCLWAFACCSSLIASVCRSSPSPASPCCSYRQRCSHDGQLPGHPGSLHRHQVIELQCHYYSDLRQWNAEGFWEGRRYDYRKQKKSGLLYSYIILTTGCDFIDDDNI